MYIKILPRSTFVRMYIHINHLMWTNSTHTHSRLDYYVADHMLPSDYEQNRFRTNEKPFEKHQMYAMSHRGQLRCVCEPRCRSDETSRLARACSRTKRNTQQHRTTDGRRSCDIEPLANVAALDHFIVLAGWTKWTESNDLL